MGVSPQRLSGWILTGVALFTLSVIIVLVVRGRPAREQADLPPSRADFHIKEIRLQEQGSGDVHWRLIADQAEIFEDQGKTVMRKVTVTIQEPDRTWTVTGEEGDLLNATKDVEIRKNVVLISSDGLRLETDRLSWQAKERRVWTTRPVTIFREGAIIRGEGLDAWISEQRTRVTGRLRATFSEALGAPARPGAEQERSR